MTQTGLEKTYAYEEHSAAFWSMSLGKHSANMAAKADGYTTAAAVISALTGAAAWATITGSTKWWSQALVMVMALTAAFVGIVPKTRGYADCAIKSADLAYKYGMNLVRLRLAHDDFEATPTTESKKELTDAFAEFGEIRRAKCDLHPFPDYLEEEVGKQYEELGLEQPPKPV